MRMGATHFLMKTLPRVASEMALHVLAYNLTRVMNIIGIQTAHDGDQGLVDKLAKWLASPLSPKCARSGKAFQHNQDP